MGFEKIISKLLELSWISWGWGSWGLGLESCLPVLSELQHQNSVFTQIQGDGHSLSSSGSQSCDGYKVLLTSQAGATTAQLGKLLSKLMANLTKLADLNMKHRTEQCHQPLIVKKQIWRAVSLFEYWIKNQIQTPWTVQRQIIIQNWRKIIQGVIPSLQKILGPPNLPEV